MFSLVIPAYNDLAGVRRLLATLDAIGEPVEAIVVDDASPDGLGEALSGHAPAPHVTFRLLRNETNLGPGPSRNRGADAATRDHLLFLDADDWLCPCIFDVLRDNLPTGTCAFTLFRYHFVDTPGAPYTYRMIGRDEALWNAARSVDLEGPIRLRDAPDMLRTVAFPWNKLYRTRFVREAGIRFPDLRLQEDVEPHWRSFLMAERFRVLDAGPPLLHHFQIAGAGRATNEVSPRRLLAFEAIDRCFDALAPLREDKDLFAQFAIFSMDLCRWAVSLFEGDPLSARAQGAAGRALGRLDAHARARGWVFAPPEVGPTLAQAAADPLSLMTEAANA